MIKPILTSLGVSKDGKTITLQDITGVYNNPDNLGGYGAPNAASPQYVGFTLRYWADDLPYINKIFGPGTPRTELLTAGHAFSLLEFGQADEAFSVGVHHIKYYPFEPVSTVVTMTQGSKKITRTAGLVPSAFDVDYVAVLVSSAGNPVSSVLMIDKTQTLTGTEFYVDQEWGNPALAGCTLQLATEADLKVLVSTGAECCVAGKIGALAIKQYCQPEEVNQLEDLIAWIFAAGVKMQLYDYTGAHNLIVGAYTQCSDNCPTTYCKTCAP